MGQHADYEEERRRLAHWWRLYCDAELRRYERWADECGWRTGEYVEEPVPESVREATDRIASVGLRLLNLRNSFGDPNKPPWVYLGWSEAVTAPRRLWTHGHVYQGFRALMSQVRMTVAEAREWDPETFRMLPREAFSTDQWPMLDEIEAGIRSGAPDGWQGGT